MTRLLIEALLLVSPFVLYQIYVFIHGRFSFRPPLRISAWILWGSGLVLAIVGFFALADSPMSSKNKCFQPGQYVDGAYIKGKTVACAELNQADSKKSKLEDDRKMAKERKKAEAEAKAKSSAKSRAEAKAKSRAEAKAKAEARAKAKAEARAEAKAEARAEARRKRAAEAEARRKRAAEEATKTATQTRNNATEALCRDSGHYLDGEYVEGAMRPCAPGETP